MITFIQLETALKKRENVNVNQLIRNPIVRLALTDISVIRIVEHVNVILMELMDTIAKHLTVYVLAKLTSVVTIAKYAPRDILGFQNANHVNVMAWALTIISAISKPANVHATVTLTANSVTNVKMDTIIIHSVFVS